VCGCAVCRWWDCPRRDVLKAASHSVECPQDGLFGGDAA
jgi:hypothetical protein